MPINKVQDLLKEKGIEFSTIEHRVAYTAQEEAAAAHVPGREWAKTVIFHADGEPILAVLPATHQVDPERLAALAGCDEIRLATEDELGDLFPECELGAVPPFGALWGYPVYADRSLVDAGRIAFHAGSHREAVSMEFSDFVSVAGPRMGAFARNA